MHPQITVITPTLPARNALLVKALRSVARQTLPAAAISVAADVTGAGAAATRQRALDAVRTEWTACLDDDDIFMADHLRKLYEHAIETDADMVYSWFEPVNMIDPFPPGHYLNEFDPNNPIETTITVLVKTELAKEVGYAPLPGRPPGTNSGEDYGFTTGLVALGAKISHLVDRTWYYVAHGDGKTHGNTSGLPTKGDALLWTPSS